MSIKDGVTKFKCDYCRTYKKQYTCLGAVKRMILSRNLRFLFSLRVLSEFKIGKIILWYYRNRYGIEIPVTCGGGLVLTHPYGITINGKSTIGEDCTFFKGVTIGSIRSGKNCGTPILENNIVVCANAMICGAVHIGTDVLIASNAFVNFDVPNHSIVIGNPGIIHRKVGASADYI